MNHHCGQGSAVQVRLLGEREDIEMLASLLTCSGAEIVTRTGPRANRTDPGVRVYLTVRLPADSREGHGRF